MGLFLAASAFRHASPEQIAGAIDGLCSHYGVPCEEGSAGESDESRDVLLYAPSGGWTVVLWPAPFVAHDVTACQELSGSLHVLVSTVHIYDADYWTHVLFDDGRQRDQFCSDPYYFPEEVEADPSLRAQWSGQAGVVGALIGIPPTLLAPYFEGSATATGRRAFADDQFPVSDVWVFVDLWRRMGIEYPEDVGVYEHRIRLGTTFERRLPTNETPF